jgi:hypothetical protein
MKLQGLRADEKRWRALPQRMMWAVKARMPGARSRFERMLAEAVAAEPLENLGYVLPFVLAERILGEAAIIDADPRSIDRWLVSEAKLGDEVQSPRDHFLIDGPWRALVRPLEESRLDDEVREFIADSNYRRARVYGKLAKRLSERGAFLRNGVMFRTLEDIDAYCHHHVRLIESIRTNGVVRRSELGRIGVLARRSTPNAAFLESVETDAGVAVSPRGRLLRYRGGFHRTAAARELGLSSMPVQVKLVHLTWLRKLVRESGLPPLGALVEGLKRLSVPVHTR